LRAHRFSRPAQSTTLPLLPVEYFPAKPVFSIDFPAGKPDPTSSVISWPDEEKSSLNNFHTPANFSDSQNFDCAIV
jgi:hypothetical protein